MADERPEKTDGKGGSGPNDQGHGRRGGRRRGFRGRRGGGRDNTREATAGRNPPGESPSSVDEQARQAGQAQGRESQPRPREQREQRDPRPARPEESARQEPARDMPACPLCGKPVYDLSTAIAAARETGEPAHFDCVLERVAASETLESGEKLVYLGSGAFGVVEFKDKSEAHFAVKRRIQWEKEGEKKDWRRGLSSRISNL
jgi:hypothetical protein